MVFCFGSRGRTFGGLSKSILFLINKGKYVATITFQDHKYSCHPVAAKMVAINYKIATRNLSSFKFVWNTTQPLLLISVGFAVVGVSVFFVFSIRASISFRIYTRTGQKIISVVELSPMRCQFCYSSIYIALKKP